MKFPSVQALVLLIATAACAPSTELEASDADNAAPLRGTAAVPATGQTYQLINLRSGLALDVAGTSQENLAPIVQNTPGIAKSQQWTLKDAGNGTWQLVNANSGRCLDNNGLAAAQGVQMIQWDCKTSAAGNQQFTARASGTGYKMVSALNQLLMDDYYNATTVGSRVVLWADNGGVNQQWSFVPVSLAPTSGSTAASPAPFHQALYNPNLPVYPQFYSANQILTQQQDGNALWEDLTHAIDAGATFYTVPAGVYRMPSAASPLLSFWQNYRGFTLYCAGVTFIFPESTGSIMNADHAANLAIIGPVVFDYDPLPFTQAQIDSYDPASGTLHAHIMAGYSYAPATISVGKTGTAVVFSPDGTWQEVPSYDSYIVAQAPDGAGNFVLTVDKMSPFFQSDGFLLFSYGVTAFNFRDVENFTLQDATINNGGMLAWGGGSGNFNFIRVHGGRMPGSNRLQTLCGPQLGNRGGNVLFDTCEFGQTTDDVINYGNGAMGMAVKLVTPNLIQVLNLAAQVGDTVSFYDVTSFNKKGSARVTATTMLNDTNTLQHALAIVNSTNLQQLTSGSLYLVTLDQAVNAAPTDIVSDDAMLATSFTVRNSYLHDSAVRVMASGFRQATFSGNTFERINGGLALTPDVWWWGGAPISNVTISDNFFIDSGYSPGWGASPASITLNAGQATPLAPGQTYSASPIVIVRNHFTNSARSVVACQSCSNITFSQNTVTGASSIDGAVLDLESVSQVQISDNVFKNIDGPLVKSSYAGAVIIQSNSCSGPAPASCTVQNANTLP